MTRPQGATVRAATERLAGEMTRIERALADWRAHGDGGPAHRREACARMAGELALVREQYLRALADAGRDLTDAEKQVFQASEELLAAVQALGRVSDAEIAADEEALRAARPQAGGSTPSRGPRVESGITLLRPQDSVGRPGWTSPEGIAAEELDFGRYLKGCVTGNWRGAEAERRLSNSMGGGSGPGGGFLLPEPLSVLVIDLARARARVMEAGATTISMETGELRIARITKDPPFGWKAENALGTIGDAEVGDYTLRPRTLFGGTTASVELIEDASNAGQIILGALTAALGNELDRVMLYGNGVTEPNGLRNRTSHGVNSVAAGGAPTYGHFSQAVQKIAEGNGPSEGLAAILSPRDWGTLDRLADSTGQPLVPPKSFQDLVKLPTTQVPTNLDPGGNKSEAYVGYFPDMLIGVRLNIVLQVSREAGEAFQRYQVLIRAVARVDMALGHPAWFTMITGTA
jgi:HK97 family phage major capsid protein